MRSADHECVHEGGGVEGCDGFATFDRERRYRFVLHRSNRIADMDLFDQERALETGRRRWLFVCNNPSDAGGIKNDPTVRVLCNFMQRDGGLWHMSIVNVHALIGSDPAILRAAPHASVSPMWAPGLNDAFILTELDRAQVVVLAWGPTANVIPGRIQHVLQSALNSGKPLKCFGRTKDGSPPHPTRRRLVLEDFRG